MPVPPVLLAMQGLQWLPSIRTVLLLKSVTTWPVVVLVPLCSILSVWLSATAHGLLGGWTEVQASLRPMKGLKCLTVVSMVVLLGVALSLCGSPNSLSVLVSVTARRSRFGCSEVHPGALLLLPRLSRVKGLQWLRCMSMAPLSVGLVLSICVDPVLLSEMALTPLVIRVPNGA